MRAVNKAKNKLTAMFAAASEATEKALNKNKLRTDTFLEEEVKIENKRWVSFIRTE